MKTILLAAACCLIAVVASEPLQTPEALRPGAAAQGAHQQAVSARTPQPSIAGRIGNVFISMGTNATLGQFPWQVAITIETDLQTLFCGGAIIGDRWILTAGHCVEGALSFTIKAGTLHSRNSTEDSLQTFRTTEFVRHPQYSIRFFDNDIALLHLPGSIGYSEFVRPVQLPSHTMALESLVGKTPTISGWGWAGDQNRFVSETLQFTKIPITNNTDCDNFYGPYRHIMTSTKICCSTPDYHSTCKGDSGGSLVIEDESGVWTTVGIVSFGYTGGCSQGAPVAFTRVTEFLEFIETTTNIAIRP